MRHLNRISKAPAPAQNSGLCEDITSTAQAKFCFAISLLEGFLLPVIQLKENTGNPPEEQE